MTNAWKGGEDGKRGREHATHEVNHMKVGTISSWNKEKFVGTIIDRSVDPPQRYFLFGSRILLGPEPFLGAQVTFDVSERQPQPGKLPVAVHVVVCEVQS
jgi:hypothetical protein